MQTVLYAIDHMKPDKQSLAYALTLCRRMMTRLDVLHILQTPHGHRYPLKRITSGILKARDAFEKTMVKATFAEAGAPDYENVLKEAAYEAFQRVLPDATDSRFDYHCIVTIESADTVIQRYVHDHRKVILAVFDTPPYVLAFQEGREYFAPVHGFA